jgi:hypothetical protein
MERSGTGLNWRSQAPSPADVSLRLIGGCLHEKHWRLDFRQGAAILVSKDWLPPMRMRECPYQETNRIEN